jgi:hypothetical protein
MVTLMLLTVPSDVRCVRVEIENGQKIRRSFDVKPGDAKAALTVPMVPIGLVEVRAAAFAVACADVTSSTQPSWNTEEVVEATVVATKTVMVQVNLVPTGSLAVTGNFEHNVFVVLSSQLDFGTVTSRTETTRSLTIHNAGKTTLGPFSFSIPTTFPFGYSVVGTPCRSVRAGESCDVTIRFFPPVAHDMPTTLTVSASPGGMRTVKLVGKSLTPGRLTITPAFHDFGEVEAGVRAGPVVFTIRNVGQTPVGLGGSLNGTSMNGNPFEDVFTCNMFLIGANGTCIVSVTALSQGSPGTAYTARLTVGAPPLVPEVFADMRMIVK